VNVTLKRGERVRLETPGGGGYGDQKTRSDKALQNDLDLGFVTSRGNGSSA
jgi:N-methylhydantoinase B